LTASLNKTEITNILRNLCLADGKLSAFSYK